MAELEPWMAAQGIFLDSTGIPTLPDGTPALPQNRPPSDIPRGDTSAPLLAQMAQIAGLTGQEEAPPDPQIVDGFPYPQDPLGYGFGPYYRESPTDFRDTGRAPLAPPLWNLGMEGPPPEGALVVDKPDDWKRFYTPNDRSTGGGFFLAKDALGGEVPFAFQQGASSPSTNNWRLFGGHPRQVMRNGRIINLDATDLRGPPVPDIGFGNNYGGPLWNLGVGAAMGYPAGRSAGYTQSFGWPGSDSWAMGTYWTG